MGFERMVGLMQGVSTIFETDLFAPIVSAVLSAPRQSNPKLPAQLSDQQQQASRIVADHTRASTFLLADGFTPSNEGVGYVVRRIIRRAYQFGRNLGIEEPFVHTLVPVVVEVMGDVYPEVREAQPRIGTWLQREEKQFAETLERGLGPLTDSGSDRQVRWY